jgi:CPA1 family monovalent cation:H+ antiporter
MTHTPEGIVVERSLERFLLVLTLSLSVTALSRLSSWLRQVPYTLLLVIVGLGLAFIDVRLVNLSPELILTIFLPPLLFEAAWNSKWTGLKQDWVPILLFAVVGVVISVGGIALGLNHWAGLSLPIALLVGASLSSTDPVAVISLFRELGASQRLTTLMEGESLFNDGVVVAAFGLLVGLPLGNTDFVVSEAVIRFFTFVGIGIGVGGAIGFSLSYLTQRFDLPMVEQSLTLVAAYGSYLLVEELGGSGIIGVVTTGLILGNFGSRFMNSRTRLLVTEFWDFAAFFVNSIIFLLMGDQVGFQVLADNALPIAVAIAAALVARAVSIFGLGSLSNRFCRCPISLADQSVLWWGGLRGSVSIALALSVPVELPQRQTVIAIVFGVVLFTLLAEGLTTKPLLVKLDLLGDLPLRQQYSEQLARRVALSRVLKYLEITDKRDDIDPEFYQSQMAAIEAQLERVEDTLAQLQVQHPQLRDFATEQLRSKLLELESDTYAELVRAGYLNSELSPILKICTSDCEPLPQLES